MKTKTHRSKILLALGASAAIFAGNAMADGVTTSFGSLPAGNDFAGSGIASNSVAFTTTTIGNDVITLGLSATPRGSGAPAVTSDGINTFFAQAGAQPGNRAEWNFDWYIANSDGLLADNDTYSLTYGTTSKTASFDPTLAILGNATTSTSTQNSENLGFSFLGAPIGFDPTANGVYDFTLDVTNPAGSLIASDSIQVDVGTAPDATSTLALLGAAVGGLFIGRKLSFIPTA